MFTEEYAPGRPIDVHGEGQDGIALMLHGRGPNERAAWAPLARGIAPSGVRKAVDQVVASVVAAARASW